MNFIKEEKEIYLLDEQHKKVAFITFPLENGYYHLDHTYVDDCLRGQGIASKLVNLVMQEARAHHRMVYITCSYARTWIQHHKEYQDLWLSSL